MSATKSIAKPKATAKPPTVSPAAMQELCHDALATGVLEKHEGLPDSWLKLFKEHANAWDQLKAAVLNDPALDKVRFTRDSYVAVTILCEDVMYNTVTVPAHALPTWFCTLLKGYWDARADFCYSSYMRHDFTQTDGNGGTKMMFANAGDVIKLWADVCDKYRVEDAVAATRYGLWRDFAMDTAHELAEEIAEDEIENPNDALGPDADVWDLLERHETRVEAVLEDELGFRARTELIEREWFDALHQKYGTLAKDAPYLRAPELSIYVNQASEAW